MEGVPVFLNERSTPIGAAGHELKGIVVSLLRALQTARDQAGLIYLGTEVPLAALQLTDDYQTLGGVLEGDRDWWRFVQSLEQRSPYSTVPQSVPPDAEAHVEPGSTEGRDALLWSAANESFVASFPSAEEWRRHEVAFRSCTCASGRHDAATEERVRNLALPEHAEHWADALRTYAYSPAASAAVYECQDFVLKMFLNDHNPPHVHVYSARAGECLALVRFDVEPEVLRGLGLKGAVRAEVFRILDENRDSLLTSWTRCRTGYRPNLLLLPEA